MSSLFELQTQLEISKNLRYLNDKQYDITHEDTREIERMLSSYIKKINN